MFTDVKNTNENGKTVQGISETSYQYLPRWETIEKVGKHFIPNVTCSELILVLT